MTQVYQIRKGEHSLKYCVVRHWFKNEVIVYIPSVGEYSTIRNNLEEITLLEVLSRLNGLTE